MSTSPSPAPPVAELSARAIILGLVIGSIMTAANTYLGLYAGMTVSASIPSAIVSMGVLRGILRRGTILENNIVQTISAAGVSIASGVIFTVPALVIAGVWTDFPYWEVTLIGLLGGVLGVAFMIPLRKTLIVEEEELVYPEGVACAKVLEAGQGGGASLAQIAAALGVGVLFKGLIGIVGILRATVEGAQRVAGTLFYFGTDVSVALLGVGVIVGLEVSALVFFGGALGWIIAIPLYYLSHPLPDGAPLDAAWDAWSSQIRYMGVGAMIVGGLWSMVSIRHGIVKAMREAVSGFRSQNRTLARTEQDLPTSKLLIVLVVTTVLVFFLYQAITGSAKISFVASLVMVIASFFFVAVSSYIVGLVGSSNNPISGMTICALILASIVLLVLGMTGPAGILGALGVAGVVCCAAASAGDTSQDLKTGYLVGATPWRQQIAQLIGTIFPALLIAPILTLLQKGYGIGTGGAEALRAPQATLFASIAKALFEHSGLPWNMVIMGAGIAVALVALDEYLRIKKMPFRAYVMPVAVGIYLPMSLSVPILIGGFANYWLRRTAGARGPGFADAAENKAVLLSSGLIAGEAVAGIVIAVPRTLGIELPIPVIESDLLTLAALAAVTLWVYRTARAATPAPGT